jgi:Double zinc ribbon
MHKVMPGFVSSGKISYNAQVLIIHVPGGMRISGMKKKKQTICPRCKKTVPAKTVFCESCGARVAHPPSCSLCGTLLAPGSRFCSSCGTPVSTNMEQLEERADPSETNFEGASQSPENKTGFVPVVPESVDETHEKNIPVISKTTENRKALKAKRSVVTVVSDPDTPSRTVFSQIPVAWIASHSYLILILIAVVVIASLAVSGMIKLPAPDYSSGDVTNLSADETRSMPDSSDVSYQDQVVTTTTTVSPVINLTPGPTQVPPDNLLVYFQAERDPITRIVSVMFMGGKGQAGVSDVFVRLTRSDGQVLTGTFKPIQVGSGIELPGTEKEDRVEVIVHYYTGDTYTVIDRTFAWKKQV